METKLEEALKSLKDKGCILSFSVKDIDWDGKVGKGPYRNSQQLDLVFPDGSSISIRTACSGASENSVFELKRQKDKK